MVKPDWWPDWHGRAAAIVASGPSARKANVGLLQGRVKAIAIKESHELCPWADAVYGCDSAWWKNCNGLIGYQGIKITFGATLRPSYPDIRSIEIDRHGDKILTDKIGFIGSGGNSGFQAINLAVQFGAKRILLIGFDVHGRNGLHWYGRNNGPGRNNPNDDNFKRWREALDNAVPEFERLGVSVLNASFKSDLKGFRKVTVEEALAEWRL